MIRLEPMDEAAYERWLATSIPEFAQENVEAGTWLESEALERSAQSYRELLPDGLETPGHVIRSIVNDDDEQVGYVRWAPADRPSGRVAFIYDMAVYPEHRRRGYAQAASTRSRRGPANTAAPASSSTSTEPTRAHASSTSGRASSRPT